MRTGGNKSEIVADIFDWYDRAKCIGEDPFLLDIKNYGNPPGN